MNDFLFARIIFGIVFLAALIYCVPKCYEIALYLSLRKKSNRHEITKRITLR